MPKLHQIAFQIGGKLASSFKSSMTAATTGIEDLGRRAKTLEQGGKQIDRFRSLRNSVKQTEEQFEAAKVEADRLTRMIVQIDKPSKTLQKSFEQAQKKANKLNKSLTNQKNSLQKLKGEMDAAGISTSDLVGEQKRLATALGKTQAAQDKLESVMARRQANLNKRAGYRGQLLDAFAGGMALKSVFQPAIGFEQAMAKVKSISGATGAEFQALVNNARELGRTTSWTASEVADGQKYLAQAGFESNQIVAAMPGVLNLARAGTMDLGRAADISSDILSAFGKDASEMGRVSDILTRTFTTSNTSLELLGETMKYVGPIALKAGISLEQTAAMAGMLGDVGIKGSQAGTALRAMILRLSAPPKMAITALEKIKVKTKDAAGNLRPIGDIMQDISDKTKNMGTADRLAIMSKIFGKEASAAASELIGKAQEAEKQSQQALSIFEGTFVGDALGLKQGAADKSTIAGYFKTIEETSEGAAARIAAVQRDTTQGAFKALGSSVEAVSITFSSLFLPALRGIAAALKVVADFTTGLVERFPILTTVVGGAVFGLMALKVATIGLGYAFTFVKGSVLDLMLLPKKMTKAFAKFKAGAFLASMKMVAIRTKTAALSLWGFAKNAVVAAGSGIKKLAIGMFSFAKTAIPVVLGGLKSIAIALWANPIVLIGAAIAGAAVLIYKFWEPISDFFAGLWDGIKETFSAAWDWLTGFSLFDSGESIMGSLADGILSMVTAPARAVMSAFDWIADLLPFSDAKKGPLSRLTKSGQSIVTTVGQGVQKAGPEAIQAPLTKAFGSMGPVGTKAAATVSADQLPLTRAASNNITVNISPTINLAAGMSKRDIQDSVDESLAESERRIKEVFERLMAERERLNFGPA